MAPGEAASRLSGRCCTSGHWHWEIQGNDDGEQCGVQDREDRRGYRLYSFVFTIAPEVLRHVRQQSSGASNARYGRPPGFAMAKAAPCIVDVVSHERWNPKTRTGTLLEVTHVILGFLLPPALRPHGASLGSKEHRRTYEPL